MDQRGHGLRTRCPGDVSCGAFVGDVVDVLDEVVPGQRCVLVGQSMGAHTAFLTAAARPDLVDRLVTPEGLMPRFDADIMERTILEVHAARWAEWEALEVPTLAVFAAHGMFSDEDKEELIRRRRQTDRIDLATGSHDAHLDAFEEWVDALQGWLGPRGESSAT